MGKGHTPRRGSRQVSGRPAKESSRRAIKLVHWGERIVGDDSTEIVVDTVKGIVIAVG